DRLAGRVVVHARHAHQTGPAVDLCAAGAAAAGLAVPADGQIRGLSRLDLMHHVKDDHTLGGRRRVLLEAAARGVAAPDPHRDRPAVLGARVAGVGHHCFSSMIALSSSGISGRGSWQTLMPSSVRRVTTFTLPNCGSVAGKSSRVWPPRLSFRSIAE